MRVITGSCLLTLLWTLPLLLSPGAAWAQGYAPSAVAVVGDPAPGTGGGTYSDLSVGGINASGDVAFWASVTGGTVGEGIFVASGGTHTAVVLLGDPAPAACGGTYSDLFVPRINASGEVAFRAAVSGGLSSQGIFVDSGSTSRVAALLGDDAPG